MITDQLIAELVSSPPARSKPKRRVFGAIVAGWLAAMVGLALVEGRPMAMVAHTGVAPFAVKISYTLAMATLVVIAAVAAGRPGRKPGGSVAMVAVPVLILGAVAAVELATADRSSWSAMAFGSTYWSCFASVVSASVPVFIGMTWAYRILAPTRLALAGFLIGLSAGAAGAAAFALYCHETAASFLVMAYTPAMLVPAVIGAIAARPLLKW